MTGFTFYGVNFQELVLFGILIYLAALLLVILFVRCIQLRTFCPFSGEGVHCTYVNSCRTCTDCSLRQSAKSIFCCRRRHSVYDLGGCEIIPKCKLNCFRPDCNYLRCCCCEFFVETTEEFPTKKVIDV